MLSPLICLLAAAASVTGPSVAETPGRASSAFAISVATPSVGAWDTGPFDNDAAADWFARFSASPSWSAVQEALAAGQPGRGYLEVDEASVAVAAAAVVAATRTGRVNGLPADGRATLAQLGKPSDGLIRAALASLDRVQRDSELAELWAEGGDPSPWLVTLGAIRNDLR